MHKANICVTSASVAGRGGVEMCFVQWVTVCYLGLRKSILLGVGLAKIFILQTHWKGFDSSLVAIGVQTVSLHL